MEKVCTGACLFGKCPYPKCIRNEGTHTGASINAEISAMLGAEKEVRSNRTGIGAAVDIGSTTLAAALIDMASGKTLKTASRVNPQIAFGLDVVSRIQYATEHEDGTEKQRAAIVKAVNELIAELGESVERIAIAGNTTMLCLFTGLNPAPLGHTPFTPPSLFGETFKASELGLDFGDIPVYLAPSVSAFVGADITAGIYATAMRENAPSLLIDIGTNGEIALAANGKLYTTATAAGPALEGAELSNGMGGTKGAISEVVLREGAFACTVLGGGEPRGICGSGIVDAVAALIDTEILDPTGRLDMELAEQAGIAAEEDGVVLMGSIGITGEDIRKIQLAKAAICAGIHALAAQAGVKFEDIKAAYIAGGFGNYLRLSSALKIGLMPPELEGKLIPSKNTSLTGAIMALCSSEAEDAMKALAAEAFATDLATDEVFMDMYIECMMFGEL